MKILYVDDERINLDLLEFHFEDTCEVLTCTSASEGLKILHEIRDITEVISDMKMMGMNGLEFITEAQKTFPDKNYYILSGFDITDNVREAIKNGIVLEYFKKPCNFQAMIKTLKNNRNRINPTINKDNSNS
ncbi:MAG: response regulator [Bacteroidota bacterium]